jgi:hypothetical protein
MSYDQVRAQVVRDYLDAQIAPVKTLVVKTLVVKTLKFVGK